MANVWDLTILWHPYLEAISSHPEAYSTVQQPPDSSLKRAVGLVGVVALLLAAIPNLGHVEGLLGVLALEVVLALAKLSAFLSLYLSVLNINVRSHNMLLHLNAFKMRMKY